jgi:hypothetical protein
MRKTQAVAVELVRAPFFPWALLFAEFAAGLELLSSGAAPALLVRCLQLFLRF